MREREREREREIGRERERERERDRRERVGNTRCKIIRPADLQWSRRLALARGKT